LLLFTAILADGVPGVAATDLPVGMEAESTVVTAVFRAVLTLWAIVLLLIGCRIPRCVVGTLLMIVGLAVGGFAVAELSLVLALAAALLVFAVGMACHLYLPRLLMGVAMLWPLPTLYLAHLYFSGSFEWSLVLAIGLGLAGVALGAALPNRSLVVLSAALGTVLLFAVGPVEAGFSLVVAILCGAVVWQLVVLGAWRHKTHQRTAVGRRHALGRGDHGHRAAARRFHGALLRRRRRERSHETGASRRSG
jgi:hypothetical protein